MSEIKVVASEIVAESSKIRYLCNICNVSFCTRGNLNKHLGKFHQLQIEVQAHRICALCNERFGRMAQLHEHILTQHSISLKFDEKTFYLKTDFLDWKNKMEKESLSSYVLKTTSAKKFKDFETSFYECHRSGHSKVKKDRTRRLKSSGSVKTGTTCPACVKVSTHTVDGISEIKVQHQSVHLGHDLDTRTLTLTKKEKENLAACLKLGISMDKILEEARQNFSPTNRLSHLTRKHLHNIRRKFGIPMYDKKPQKVNVPLSTDGEASSSSIGYQDYIEIDVSNHEEIQEHEKNSAVTSLLLLQNNNCSEEFYDKKVQIINQLKELQSRIEEWDPVCPLPNVEDHIKAINAHLDISASSNRVLNLQGMLPVFTPTPPGKPVTKRRRITKTKGSNKKQLN